MQRLGGLPLPRLLALSAIALQAIIVVLLVVLVVILAGLSSTQRSQEIPMCSDGQSTLGPLRRPCEEVIVDRLTELAEKMQETQGASALCTVGFLSTARQERCDQAVVNALSEIYDAVDRPQLADVESKLDRIESLLLDISFNTSR